MLGVGIGDGASAGMPQLEANTTDTIARQPVRNSARDKKGIIISTLWSQRQRELKKPLGDVIRCHDLIGRILPYDS